MTALSIAAFANAQFNIGLKGVINVSNIRIEGKTSDAKIGFAGGPYAEFGFTDMFGITTELLYNEKGGREVVSGT